jgi:hypothetical protein
VTGPVTLEVDFTCARSGGTVPPDLIGKELDIAEAELNRLHIPYHEVDASHSAFGIIEQGNWTVCQTYPDRGNAVRGSVQLFAQQTGCQTQEGQ